MKKVLMLVMVLCLGFAGAANAFIMIGFEAEPGINGSTWARSDSSGTEWVPPRLDAGASGGLYIGTENGDGNNNNNPPAEGSGDDGMSGYRFYAPAGSYAVILRYKKNDSNSFWIRIVDSNGDPVDDSVNNRVDQPGTETWVRDNSLRGPNNWWLWDRVLSDDDGDKNATFILPEDGEYEVQIARREDGVYLDGFVITDATSIDEREMPDYIPYLQPVETTPANGAKGVAGGFGQTFSVPAEDGVEYEFFAGSNLAFLLDPDMHSFYSMGTATGSGGIATVTNGAVPLPENKETYLRVNVAATSELYHLGSFFTYNPGPVIVSQPGDEVQIGLDCTATLEVIATSGDDNTKETLDYQWADSVGDLAGETGATLTTGVDETYTCTVTNSVTAALVTTSPTIVNVAAHDEFVFTSEDIAGKAFLLPGSSSYDAATGELTVIGSGRDIWNEDDEFHFVFAPCTGDGEWIARITNLENPGGANSGDNGWTKGGIMIRSDLSAVARNACIMMTRQGTGITFQRRENRNEGSGSNYQTPDEEVPYWLKLTRVGNTFRGYHAPDVAGAPGTWTQQGQAQGRDLNIPANAYVGFAVTSHDVHRYARGIFDNIQGFGTTWAVTPVAPAQDEEVLPTEEVILSWAPAALGPCGATYEVFMGPSAGELASIGAPISETQIDVSSLVTETSTEYFWSVTTHYGGDSEAGGVQSFRTVSATPVAVSQPAAWTVGEVDDEVVLEYVAESPGGEPVTYEWIKGVGDSNDIVVGADSELAVTIAVDTTGAYYCKSSNSFGAGDSSITAVIATKRGLIGHWEFDEIISVSAEDPNLTTPDATVFNHDCILYGEPNLAAGVTGLPGDMAIGVNVAAELMQYGVIGPVGISGNRPRTISCWVKNAVPWDQMADWQTIFGFTSDDVTTPTKPRASFDFNRRGGQDQYCIHAYGWEYNIMAIDGEWHFLTATYDGTTVRWYGDGEFVGEDPEGLNTQDLVHVGKRAHSPNLWRGWVDDARIHDYALSNAEIAAMYLDLVPGGSICAEPPPFDLDGDCIETLLDFAIWAETFGACGLVDCD